MGDASRLGPLDHVEGTVLSIWGHPDDETWLAAGLMAEAVRRGQRVVCVTATRGEQGSPDPEVWPAGDALAEVRTAELEKALAELGVTEHVWLDYPDGGCTDVSFDDAVDRVVELVLEVEPDVVLTFGPDGMTGHPDHQSVSRWVTAAVARLPDGVRRPRVLWATNSDGWMDRFYDVLEPLGVYMGFDPPRMPVSEMAVHVELSGEVLEAKLRSLRAQVSQTASLMATIGEDVMVEMLTEEAFVEADPTAVGAGGGRDE